MKLMNSRWAFVATGTLLALNGTLAQAQTGK
jgi:hypothetical protein